MTEENRDEQVSLETAAAQDTETSAEIEETVQETNDESVEEAEVAEDVPEDVTADEGAAAQDAAPAEVVSDDQKSKDQTDWKDAYVRLAADFDNYRKRTSKEFDDVRKREREKVIGIWLDVYDNTERAIAALPEKEGPWYEGFQQIIKQMDNCLAQFGIRAADDMGKPFDAKRHEAIAILPNPALENNTIMHVERKGFVYENGDVARIARVVVVRNPS